MIQKGPYIIRPSQEHFEAHSVCDVQASDDAARAGTVPRQVPGAPVHGAPGAGAVPRGQGHRHAVPRARRPPSAQPARARRTARRAHSIP